MLFVTQLSIFGTNDIINIICIYWIQIALVVSLFRCQQQFLTFVRSIMFKPLNLGEHYTTGYRDSRGDPIFFSRQGNLTPIYKV